MQMHVYAWVGRPTVPTKQDRDSFAVSDGANHRHAHTFRDTYLFGDNYQWCRFRIPPSRYELSTGNKLVDNVHNQLGNTSKICVENLLGDHVYFIHDFAIGCNSPARVHVDELPIHVNFRNRFEVAGSCEHHDTIGFCVAFSNSFRPSLSIVFIIVRRVGICFPTAHSHGTRRRHAFDDWVFDIFVKVRAFAIHVPLINCDSCTYQKCHFVTLNFREGQLLINNEIQVFCNVFALFYVVSRGFLHNNSCGLTAQFRHTLTSGNAAHTLTSGNAAHTLTSGNAAHTLTSGNAAHFRHTLTSGNAAHF